MAKWWKRILYGADISPKTLDRLAVARGPKEAHASLAKRLSHILGGR